MSERPRRRGRISFARVPTEPAREGPLGQVLVTLSNLALAAWIYPCWRTVHVRWERPFDEIARLGEISARPMIFYSWHAYEPTTMCAFRDVPLELTPTAIAHDGILSRMLQRATARLGYRVWIYRRRSPIPPRQQIIEMVQARGCNIGLFADAGGPYGRVKPGLAEIAHATKAWLVPFVVRGRPTITLKRPWHYVFPIPFSTLTATAGEPIDGSVATVEECQIALDGVAKRCGAQL